MTRVGDSSAKVCSAGPDAKASTDDDICATFR
jgi:hypothetical protein